MLISTAHAQETEIMATTGVPVEPPSMSEAFLYNAGFIVLVVFMFYFLFIRPQQKRMNEHMKMLDSLNVGDRVVTGGGLVGTVSNLIDEKEIEVDLGRDVKVVALRATLLERPAANTAKNSKEPAPKTNKTKGTKS